MPGKHYTDSPSGRAIFAAPDAHAPASVETLVRLTGYQKRTVRDMVLKLHSDGRVHVAEYRHETEYSAAPSKLWALGPGEDAQPIRRGRKAAHTGDWRTSDSAARIDGANHILYSTIGLFIMISVCFLTMYFFSFSMKIPKTVG
jgi:hypothetical protein